MLSKLFNFFYFNDFYFKFISWKKFLKIKNEFFVIYIASSQSKIGNSYLQKAKLKMSEIDKPQNFKIFINNKNALKWIDANEISHSKVAIIGFKKDSQYLYRKIKNKNLFVVFIDL